VKLKKIEPPRAFHVGRNRIMMKDCAHIELDDSEQVTFLSESGAEYDVVRKSWGFYATPSLNDRLLGFGLHGVLIEGQDGKFFIFLVEEGKEDAFKQYCVLEKLSIACWLNDEVLRSISESHGPHKQD